VGSRWGAAALAGKPALSDVERTSPQVIIFRKFDQATGYEHPHMRVVIENYRQLLKALGLSEQQIAASLQEILGNTAGA